MTRRTEGHRQAEMQGAVAESADAVRKLFQAGYSVLPALERPISLALWDELVDFLEGNVRALNKGVIDKYAVETGRSPACRQGCHHCCFQTIEVSSVELIRLALAVRCDAAARAALCERSVAIAARTAPLSKHDRYAAAIPCPVLKGTSCGLYEARPLVCRTYFSVSRTACDADWRHRALTDDRRAGAPLLGQAMIGGNSLIWGFDAAFLARGFEVIRVELAAGLAHILADPAAPERWLRGERVFDGVPEWRGAGYYAEALQDAIASHREGVL